MIRAEQYAAVRQLVCFAMAKENAAFRFQLTATLQVVQVCIEGDLPQNYHNFHVRQSGKFAIKKCSTISNLFRRWLVLGRSAAHSSSNVGIDKLEPVFATYGRRLRCESSFVQDGIHKVAGTIAGKRAAGAV